MITIPTAAGVFSLCAALNKCLVGTRPQPLAGEWVRLQPIYNLGASFGLPVRGKKLVLASGGMLAVLTATMLPHPKAAARLGLGLTLGGGASNLWERINVGAVFDYIRFPKLPGPMGRLVFNAADFAIFGGLALMAVGRERKPRP